jgi:hypothetical protein
MMMHRFKLATYLASVWLLVACQPIVITTPYPSDSSGGASDTVAGASGMAGETLSLAPGGAPEGGAAPAAGGAGGAVGEGGAGGEDGQSCSLSLRGYVKTAAGEPLSGTAVALAGSASAIVMTDATGQYVFRRLCAGSYEVTPRCAARTARLELTADTTHDFVGLHGDCVTSRVLPLIYDPLMSGSGETTQLLSTTLGVDEPYGLAQRLSELLESWTDGHVLQELLPPLTSLQFPPFRDDFRYTPQEYAACLVDEGACHTAGANYPAIAMENDLCQVVRRDNVDQVWVLTGAHLGFETLSHLNCEEQDDEGNVRLRILDVIALDYSRGLASVVSGYQAHAQSALLEAFGAEPPSSPPQASDNPYKLFTQVQATAPAAEASGCGDVHFAPNSLAPNSFGDERPAPSYCDAFGDYPLRALPLASAAPVGCAAWGCTELGYRRYWFSHLPRARWLDAEGKLSDFWRYILHPHERLAPKPVTVSCSSSHQPGWCDYVTDKGTKFECNHGEWATRESPTGFVEFLFDPPQVVTGVLLRDRACPEQVQSGHLEFSDGSPDVPFDALDPTGTLKSVSFEPKVLTGLRVHIDASTGGPNAGFAEITVNGFPP